VVENADGLNFDPKLSASASSYSAQGIDLGIRVEVFVFQSVLFCHP